MARTVKDLIPLLFCCNRALLKRATITSIDIEGRKYIPVDVDVSALDNGKPHKEGVGRTYLWMDGYVPIFSYIGTEGYILGCGFRPGTQHSQKGTPEFLEKNLAMIKQSGLQHPVLLLWGMLSASQQSPFRGFTSEPRRVRRLDAEEVTRRGSLYSPFCTSSHPHLRGCLLPGL